MTVISRKEARLQGLRFYFTDKPCLRGHLEKRQVAKGSCFLCERNASRKYARAHAAEHRQKSTAWYHANIEEAKLKHRKWVEKNRERNRENNRHWGVNNLERKRELNRNWKRNNLPLLNAHNAKRRAAKVHATPRWIDQEALKQVYLNCPTGYHVDHIVPLLSKKVCGLHVPWNLQYLSPIENIRKSNDF
jgi:hypothetical protein